MSLPSFNPDVECAILKYVYYCFPAYEHFWEVSKAVNQWQADLYQHWDAIYWVRILVHL